MTPRFDTHSSSIPARAKALLLALCTVGLLGSATAQLSVSINYSAPLCAGYNSGLATAVVSGGSAPYNYYWSNGQTGQTIANPPNGTLSVTVTDASYASANASTNVSVPAALAVAISGAPDPCVPGANYLTASVSGGVAPYVYAWTTGSSTPTAANLSSAGFYFVTVTDANGCIKVGGATYSPPVQVSIFAVPSKCGGTCDGSIEAKVTGGTAPFSFAWSNGNQPHNQQQAPAMEGTYTVTVSDGAGCTASVTGVLDDPDPISVGLAYSNPCGSPTNISANAAGGTPPYSYEWGFGQGGQTAYGVNPGTWLLKVTDSKGCAKEAWATVTTGTMSVATTSTQASCVGQGGGSATVNPTGGSGTYTYLWSNGQTTQSAVNLPGGNYTVTVSDGTGCYKVATAQVTSATPFQVSMQTMPYRCDGQPGSATVTVTGGASAGYTFKWNDPAQQTGATASNLQPGNYQVTVTNADGCKSVQAFDIPDLSMQVVTSFQNASCDDNGSAAVYVANPNGQMSYQWSNGSTYASASNLAPGSYAVTITDAQGCAETMQVDVADQSFEVEIAVLQQGCPGEPTGSVQATVTGGNGSPLTYQWSNFGQSGTIGGLMPGAYSVTVSDQSGCQKTASVQLTSAPTMELLTTTLNAPCENLSNGNVALEVNGGASPFTYQWSTGANLPLASNLAAGSYQVTVTDANGCTRQAEVSLQNEEMALSVDLLQPTCASLANGTAIVNIEGGAAPYSYNWSNGTTSSNLNDLAVGSYSVIVTDAYGCSAEQAFLAEPQLDVQAAFAWAALDCDDNGVNVQFTGQASGNANTYAWTLGNGQVVSGQNPQILVNQSPMSVTLTVTSPEGCTATASQVVEAAPISLALAAETAICEGATHEFNLTVTNPGGGSLTYDWAPDNLIVSGDGTPNPVFSGQNVGQFNVSVAVSNGTCTVSEQAVMNVTESVAVDPATVSQSQCHDLTVDFSTTANLADGFTWYFDYPNQGQVSTEQNPSFTYANAGSYQVALVPNGQCAEPLLLQVLVATPPTVSFEVAAANCDDPVTVTFTNTSNVPGGVTQFNWDFGALGTSTEANPTLQVSGNQVVTAVLTAAFGNGCQQTVSEEVSVQAFAPPVLTPQIFTCLGGETVELNPGGDPIFSYEWSGGNLGSGGSTAVNPSTTVDQTTVFTVVITAINGCSATQTVTVEVPTEAFALQPIDDIIACDNDAVTVNAQPNGGSGNVNFEWATNEDFDFVVGTDASLTVQTSTSAITYFVRATNEHGCEAMESFSVMNAVVDADFDQAFDACKGTALNFDLDGLVLEDFTNWTPFNPFTEPLFENTTFSFKLTNDFGCTGEGLMVIKVTEFTAPLDIEAEPEEIWAGKSTQLQVTENGNYLYEWTPAESLDAANISNPVATPTSTMTYKVKVTDKTTLCSQDKEIEVKVKDIICDEPYIFLPNAFTPNGDGKNDLLKLEGFNVEEMYLTIYDRWGEKVFETSSLEEGWDGTFRGQIVSGDVYGFYLTVKCPGGLEYFKKGNITVLR